MCQQLVDTAEGNKGVEVLSQLH